MAEREGTEDPEGPRTPEFEDDFIRRWRMPKPDAVEGESDPTVMSLDVAREEMFESRAYQLRPEVVAMFVERAARSTPDLPEAAFTSVLEQEMAFKLLAKRERASGLLTFMLVLVVGENRSLVTERRLVSQEQYVEFVGFVEQEILPPAVVEPPIIIGAEQWRAYTGEAQ